MCIRDRFDPADVRGSLIAAVSVKVQEPIFESQTKTKLGSTHMETNGRNPVSYTHLDVYKRQLTRRSLMARIIKVRPEMEAMMDENAGAHKDDSLIVSWESLETVSYTHLDVYKRQP